MRKKLFVVLFFFLLTLSVTACDKKEVNKEVLISLTEENIIEVEATSFDYTKMFKITVDNEDYVVTEDMIDSSAVNLNEVGDYQVTLTASIVDKIVGDKEYETIYTKDGILHVVAKAATEKVVVISETSVSKEIENGDNTFDFTKLFTITVDGENVTVTKEMIDSSKVQFNVAGSYEVTLTYTVDGKDYTKTITVTVKAEEVTGKVVELAETSVSKEIENGDNTFDFTKLFTITVDGENVTVTKEMIDISLVRFDVANTYPVTLNYTVDGKNYTKTVNVTVKAGATTEQLQALKTASEKNYTNYTLTIQIDEESTEVIERTETILHANLGSYGEALFILQNGSPTKYYKKNSSDKWELQTIIFTNLWTYTYAPYMYDLKITPTDFNFKDDVYTLKKMAIEKYEFLVAPYQTETIVDMQVKVNEGVITEIDIQGSESSYKMYFTAVGTTTIEDPSASEEANNEFAGIYVYMGVYLVISNDLFGAGTVKRISSKEEEFDYVIKQDENKVTYLDVNGGDYSIYKSAKGVTWTDIYGSDGTVQYTKTDKLPEPQKPEELPENPDNLPYIGKFVSYDNSGTKTNLTLWTDGTARYFTNYMGTWKFDEDDPSIIHLKCSVFSYDLTVIQDGVLFAVNLDRPDDVGSLRIFVRENEHEYQEQYYKQGVAYLTIYNNIMTFIYYANGYVVTTEDVIAPEVYIHLYDTEGKLITVVQRASSLNTGLKVIEATAGTYNKGDSVLIIDGFGKATYNGESCEYYSTPFNRVVVKTKAGSVGLALNVDDMTFELAEQDGHQGEYRNDGSIVITIDGWGGMFTDPQDEMLSPSFYTYVLDGRDLTATIDGINHYYTFRSYGNALVRKQDGTVWQRTGTHYEIEVDITQTNANTNIPYGDTNFDFTKLFNIWEDGMTRTVKKEWIDVSLVNFTNPGTYKVTLVYKCAQLDGQEFTKEIEVTVLDEGEVIDKNVIISETDVSKEIENGDTDFDFTKLFKITVDGKDVPVTEEMIDSSKVQFDVADSYEVTLTYTVDEKEYTKTISVTVKAKAVEGDISLQGTYSRLDLTSYTLTLSEKNAATYKAGSTTYEGTWTQDEQTKKITITLKASSSSKTFEVTVDEKGILFAKDVSLNSYCLFVKGATDIKTLTIGSPASIYVYEFNYNSSTIKVAMAKETYYGEVQADKDLFTKDNVVTITKDGDEICIVKISYASDTSATGQLPTEERGTYTSGEDSIVADGFGTLTGSIKGTYIVVKEYFVVKTTEGEKTLKITDKTYSVVEYDGFSGDFVDNENEDDVKYTLKLNGCGIASIEKSYTSPTYGIYTSTEDAITIVFEDSQSSFGDKYGTIVLTKTQLGNILSGKVLSEDVTFYKVEKYKAYLEVTEELVRLLDSETEHDFKQYFKLSYNGENVEITDEMIKSTVKFGEAGFYTVTLTYTVNDETYTYELQVEIYVLPYKDSPIVGKYARSTHKSSEVKFQYALELFADGTAAVTYVSGTSETKYEGTFEYNDTDKTINVTTSSTSYQYTGTVKDGVLLVHKTSSSSTYSDYYCFIKDATLNTVYTGTNSYMNKFTVNDETVYVLQDNTTQYGVVEVEGDIAAGQMVSLKQNGVEIKLVKFTSATAYTLSSAEKNTYKVGEESFTLDGFGTYTSDSKNGTYKVINDKILVETEDEMLVYTIDIAAKTATVVNKDQFEGIYYHDSTGAYNMAYFNFTGYGILIFNRANNLATSSQYVIGTYTVEGNKLTTLDAKGNSYEMEIGENKLTVTKEIKSDYYVSEGWEFVKISPVVEIKDSDTADKIKQNDTSFDYKSLFVVSVKEDEKATATNYKGTGLSSAIIDSSTVQVDKLGTYQVTITIYVFGQKFTGSREVEVVDPSTKIVNVAETDVAKEVSGSTTSFDFKTLFKITVDGEDVEITDDMINAEAVQFGKAGTYDVTLTYELEEKTYTKTIKFTVKEKEVVITETDTSKNIQYGDTEFDFTKLFQITVDGKNVPVQAEWINTELVQFTTEGKYNVTLTYTVDDKPYECTVEVNVLKEGESTNKFVGTYKQGSNTVIITEDKITYEGHTCTYEMSSDGDKLTFTDNANDDYDVTLSADGNTLTLTCYGYQEKYTRVTE